MLLTTSFSASGLPHGEGGIRLLHFLLESFKYVDVLLFNRNSEKQLTTAESALALK